MEKKTIMLIAFSEYFLCTKHGMKSIKGKYLQVLSYSFTECACFKKAKLG